MSRGISRVWLLPEAEFISLVGKSESMSEICRALKFKPGGASRITVRSRINSLKIDTSHFKSGGSITGRNLAISWERLARDILVDNYQGGWQSPKMKAALFRLEKLNHYCALCGMDDEWQGMPLTLQMDHINGVSNDNRLENLRILCPNCHTQTPTWGRKSRI